MLKVGVGEEESTAAHCGRRVMVVCKLEGGEQRKRPALCGVLERSRSPLIHAAVVMVEVRVVVVPAETEASEVSGSYVSDP